MPWDHLPASAPAPLLSHAYHTCTALLPCRLSLPSSPIPTLLFPILSDSAGGLDEQVSSWLWSLTNPSGRIRSKCTSDDLEWFLAHNRLTQSTPPPTPHPFPPSSFSSSSSCCCCHLPPQLLIGSPPTASHPPGPSPSPTLSPAAASPSLPCLTPHVRTSPSTTASSSAGTLLSPLSPASLAPTCCACPHV
jgi:hypothetical protein